MSRIRTLARHLVQRLVEDRRVHQRRIVLVGVHAAVFVASLCLAFALRLDFDIPAQYRAQLFATLPVFVATKLVVFFLFRQYSGWWRYVSVNDVVRVAQASFLSAAVVAGLVFFAGHRGFPRSVFIIDAILTTAALGAMRVSIRMLRERILDRRQPQGPVVRTIVVGTGRNAEWLLRECERSASIGLRVVGLVSSDPGHVGSRLHDVRVCGIVEDIPRLVRDLEASQVIVALDSGDGDLVRRTVAQCNSADVKHRVLPPPEELVAGRVSVTQIRDVDLRDLLGRDPVRLDTAKIESLIGGRTVLVTGAGGSIGSELCRQAAAFGAGRLVLLEQAENPLFHLERELAATFPEVRLDPVIADITDAARIDQVMTEHRPAIVLHAAAHKHVPLMEQSPGEAIKNNILGTYNVLHAAESAGADVCVVISTDKAVRPTSVMGATKRVAELIAQALAARSKTRFVAVRFGNVLGSSGSVIPIFRQQIAAGGPVTITHPEMRRYFMTIPEATQLVLQSASLARGGEVFVLDMGEPVYIVDVARDLIRLSGLRPDIDIAIEFTGIRPGEKLFEELATTGEETATTEHDRIVRLTTPAPDARVMLVAMNMLGAVARSGGAPAEIREQLFEVLQTLERGEVPRGASMETPLGLRAFGRPGARA